MPNQTTANKTKWDEQFKIRPRRNASKKHEHIKLELVLSLLEKYRKNLYWIRIYTEYPLTNNKGETKICDVYFENIKSNEVICYEVQHYLGKKWTKETTDFYRDFDKIYFKTDWIIVKEDDISDDIEVLGKQIKRLIV